MCPALAAEQSATEPSEAIFIAQIVLLLLVARLLGEIMQRIGQPALMGQLIAGIVLGPSVFGALWPEAQHAIFATGRAQNAMLDAVSALGILMLVVALFAPIFFSLAGPHADLSVLRNPQLAFLALGLIAIASISKFSGAFLGGALGRLTPQESLGEHSKRHRLHEQYRIGAAQSAPDLAHRRASR